MTFRESEIRIQIGDVCFSELKTNKYIKRWELKKCLKIFAIREFLLY